MRRARRVVRRSAGAIAYENPWITVWHDEVDRPDGSPGIYGVVHFANLAAGVVAIDDEDRTVLVGQHRYTLDEWSWEIPEGGVPDGETPLEGAQRELREETGVEAAELAGARPASTCRTPSPTSGRSCSWRPDLTHGAGAPGADRGARGPLGAVRRGPRDDARRPDHRRDERASPSSASRWRPTGR